MMLKVQVETAGKSAVIVEIRVYSPQNRRIEWRVYRSFKTRELAEHFVVEHGEKFRVQEPKDASKTGRARLMRVTNK